MFLLTFAFGFKHYNNMRNIKNYVSIGTFWSVILLCAFSTITQIGDTLSNNLLVEGEENLTSSTPLPKKKVFYISQDGRDQIKDFEKLSLTVYRIQGEKLRTVGYGHQIKSTDPLWLRQKYLGHMITEKQAEEIFNKDIDEFVEPALNRLYAELESNGVDTNQFSQGFTDSLGSLIFNCGESGVRNTEFFRMLKKGKIRLAVSLIPTTHVYMKGHVKRRRTEANMMIEG